jgi:hypothetical protein
MADKPDTTATISDDAASAKQIIFGEQAGLMLNIDLILDKLKEVGGRDRTTIQYRNFSTIRDEKNKSISSNIYKVTSQITKNPAMQRFFYNIPSTVLSLLQPSIKLYKTFYSSDALQTSETQPAKSMKGYDWRIPFDDVSVGTVGSIESSEFINETLSNVLKGNGRLNGVGIKSFSYSYKGTNPAEINTNIVANLELYMQSPDDLLKTINVRTDDARFVQPSNSIRGLPQDLTFGYSDLVNQSARFKSNRTTESKDLEPNLHYYRIKAVVGYAMPPEHYFENLGIVGEELKNLKTAISTAKVILLLTPYSHSFDFSENGNIVLKIEYHASIDKILTSQQADIFKITPDYFRYLQTKKEYQRKIDDKEKKIKQLKCKDKTKELTKKQKEEIESENKDLLDKALKEYQLATRNMYSSILQHILNFTVNKNYTGIFKVQLHPNAIGVTENNSIFGTSFGSIFNIGGEALEAGDYLRLENLKNTRQVNSIILLNAEEKRKQQENIQQATGVRSEYFSSTPENSQDVAKKAQDRLDSIKANNNPDKDGYVNVRFIFLGDVLDAALDCIRLLQPLNDIPRIILGNIEIEVPTEFIGSNGSTESLTKKITINLADIPIAFENLYSFLIDKIIRQGRSTYPVLNFIKDVISQLVVTSVSPKYFGQSASINSSLRISTLHLAAPLKDNNVDPILNMNSSVYSDANGVMPIKIISDGDEKKIISSMEYSSESPLSKDVASYFFIYCSSQFDDKKTANEEEDNNNGIFHFRIGTDAGIVKKITFTKTDSPFYREAVAAQEGKDNVSLIKQVYDAKIEMFGNNIYRPGDIIYIEPYASFINPKKTFYLKDNKEVTLTVDLEDTVGVGGYYLVIDVETNINENVFNTSINTVFKAHRYRPELDVDNNGGCG